MNEKESVDKKRKNVFIRKNFNGSINLKFIIFVLVLFVLIIFVLTNISAQYTRSFSAYTQAPVFAGSIGQTDFPLFDREMCGAGQDFILQISPLGCTPSVIRSDLLEEQNIPVFCPITITQLNPLIDIKTIDQISFTGQLPKEVSGIGYLAPRAALGNLRDQRLSDYPVLDNIGSVVIVLKQQGNESAMPDFVEGNITARLRYDIENAFGVGRAIYYLPELSSKDWNNDFRKYGFWDGRGYLRAEEINDGGAVISIYSDRETYGTRREGEKRKLSTHILEEGETSKEFPMPGFNYCLGRMRIKLNGLENPGTRVRLNVNGDSFELKNREEFLDGKCQIMNIDKQGVTQKVKVTCLEERGRNNFDLIISPRLNLQIGGASKNYSVGDWLYDLDGGRSVYLGFIGSINDSGYEKDLYIRLIALPSGERERLTDSEISYMARFDSSLQDSLSNTGIIGTAINFGQNIFARLEAGARRFLQGRSLIMIEFDNPEEFLDKTVRLIGFAGAQDSDISQQEEAEGYYEKAGEDYKTILESFAGGKYPETEQITLGEKALLENIGLSYALNQKRTALFLCEEFGESYPDSPVPDECTRVDRLSSLESSVRDVSILGKAYSLSLDRIIEPTFEEFGAKVLVNYPNGDISVFELKKDGFIYLNESTNEFIQLVDAESDSIVLRGNIFSTGVGGKIISEITGARNERLNLGISETFGSNYRFVVQEINLKKLAKVSVIPNVDYVTTEAEFKFKIGIEKRLIQLSPEKTKDKIQSLNETIEKWDSLNTKLGNVVSGLKKACFVTGAALTFKNFISNLHGQGIARQAVMRGDEGWIESCRDRVNDGEYDGDFDKCLLENSDVIDAAVRERTLTMEVLNKEIEKIQKSHRIGGGFLGEDIINTTGFLQEFVDSNYNQEILERLQDANVNTIEIENRQVPVSILINSVNPNTITVTQARNLQLNSRLLDSPDEITRNIALGEIERDLRDIYVNAKNEEMKTSFAEESRGNVINPRVDAYYSRDSKEGIYRGSTASSENTLGITPGTPVQLIIYKHQEYTLELYTSDGNNYRIVDIYGESGKLKHDEATFEAITDLIPIFLVFDETSYQNKYENPKVRYYETDPYRGLPAIVPFDLKNGWYAAIKSTLPIGGAITPYHDSGRISSFSLCNVGEDGKAEFNSGMGDDICQLINLDTNQPRNQFYGLEPNEASELVSCAVDAIARASRAHSSGVSRIDISTRCGGRISVDVGEPAVNIPDIQCQDFMSPSDCNLLFNVCDPVVCPSSRCDLGGAYPVRDVVQSGVVGSLALCLPNFPDVKIPICLSGVHAGLKGYLSVLESYQQCLQTSLETGQNIGICDEINSVYKCEFFWRQLLPLGQYAIPKVVGSVLGQNTRGGGEYLGVQDAWQRASDSVDFYTQYYAVNSFQAFQARSAETVGSEICRNWISLAGPEGGNFFDALTQPDVPVQFYGRFDEIPFTSATNPPISHYKVFYHIYAGEDFPAYYQVYLRGSGSSFFQDTALRRIVAQGVIQAGEYATDTSDFTAPSGYQELCIAVNGNEECGFKQVTTEFGINYITEQYVASQADQIDIKGETECISGTPNIFPLLNPLQALEPSAGVQAGAGEAIDPAIYNRGITRICATHNPGQNTEATSPEEEVKARWREVGYCGDPNMKCWLDTDSVRSTIRNTNIEDKIVGDITDDYLNTLLNEGGYEQNFEGLVSEIESKDTQERISIIDEKYETVFFSNQRGYLNLLRGNSYKELAMGLYVPPALTQPEDEVDSIGTIEDFDKFIKKIGDEIRRLGVDYPIFEFDPGFAAGSLYYSYSGKNWFWSEDGEKWVGVDVSSIPSQEELLLGEVPVPADVLRVDTPNNRLSSKNKEFVESLVGESYSGGLQSLIERTIQNQEGRAFFVIKRNAELSTENVDFSHDRIFTVKRDGGSMEGRGLAHFRFDYSSTERKWRWSPDGQTWMFVPETVYRGGQAAYSGREPDTETKNLIKSLNGTVFRDGSEIIFGIDAESFSPEEEISEGEVIQGLSCTSTPLDKSDCQQVLGREIIEMANLREQPWFDTTVEKDTGIKSFGCLVLQVAYTESRILHCRNPEENNNPLYCEGNRAQLITGDNFSSLGIMQINSVVHNETTGLNDISDFEESVNYAISLLINNYDASNTFNTNIPQLYDCSRPPELGPVIRESDFQSVIYSGWERSLRAYNGWNTLCFTRNEITGVLSKVGNPNYVEDVIGYKDEVEALFPEECGS